MWILWKSVKIPFKMAKINVDKYPQIQQKVQI